MTSLVDYFAEKFPGLLKPRTSTILAAHVETADHDDAMLIVFEGKSKLSLPTGANIHTVSSIGATPIFSKEFPRTTLTYNQFRREPVVVELNGLGQAARVYAPKFNDYGHASDVVIETEGECAILVEGIDQPADETAQAVVGHQTPGVPFLNAGQKIEGYASDSISSEPDYLDLQVRNLANPDLDVRIANIPSQATYVVRPINGIGSIRVAAGEALIWEHTDMPREPQYAWTPKPGPMKFNGEFEGGLNIANGAGVILRNPLDRPAVVVTTNLGFERI